MVNFLEVIGQYIVMLRHAIGPLPRRNIYRRRFIQDCILIGVRPFLLVVVIAFALGMVVALMGVYMLEYPFIPRSVIGSLTRESILLELGATGIAALLADVLGFSLAFDLGNKVLNEQIDALEVMGVPVERYLIFPKILAGLLLIPLLIVIASFISILGGYFFCIISGAVSTADYIEGLHFEFKTLSVKVLLVKAYAFAFIIPTVSCYMGISFRGNIEELSRMSTRSIMYNCIIILICDFIITMMML